MRDWAGCFRNVYMLINEINEKRAMNLKESENAHVRVWREERKEGWEWCNYMII